MKLLMYTKHSREDIEEILEKLDEGPVITRKDYVFDVESQKFCRRDTVSIGGKWGYDPDYDMSIKLSSHVIARDNVGFQESYYDHGLGEVVTSAAQKRDILKKNDLHIVEKGEREANKAKRLAKKKEAKKTRLGILRDVANSI